MDQNRKGSGKDDGAFVGILYAQEIQEYGDALTPTAQEIVQAAGIPPSYHMDVIRGLLLAEYVAVRDRRVLKWRA